jgi:type III restriction enzyme
METHLLLKLIGWYGFQLERNPFKGETIHPGPYRMGRNVEDANYEDKATEYEVTVSKGFQTLTSSMAAMQTDQQILPFRAPVEERLLIKGMVFGGFVKCLYPAQKFDSDTERRFAIILEDETSVLKWLKPPKDVLRIYYHQDEVYQPDFVVETTEARYLCEPKRASEMTDEVVQLKAKAATIWCQHATSVSDKPWYYVLIPHDAIDASATFSSLVNRDNPR